MDARAAQIYADIIAAMQPAEEAQGPEIGSYIQLMDMISAEANKRAEAARLAEEV